MFLFHASVNPHRPSGIVFRRLSAAAVLSLVIALVMALQLPGTSLAAGARMTAQTTGVIHTISAASTLSTSAGTAALRRNHENGTFVSLPPSRILDTRTNLGVAGPVPGLSSISLQVTGRGGVPATLVRSVVLNVTVVSPSGSGYITVWPDGLVRPDSSNLNFDAGQNIPNLVVVPVGAGGAVRLFNGSAGTVQLVADVAGYTSSQPGFENDPVTSPGAISSVPPSRIMDTRTNLGAFGPVSAMGQISLQVTGRGGVPFFGVSAVILNVTAAFPSSNGFITVWPSGPRPTASNLNFQAGQNIPNLVIVPVSASGTIQLFNGSFGNVQLLADVAGYTIAGTPALPGMFQSLPPSRILDTRINLGANGPVGSLATILPTVTGTGGIPLGGVSAVALNVTAVSPTGGGFITVWPFGTPFPTASNLNFQAGQTIPNMVIVPVGVGGRVGLFNGSFGTVDLIADVAGYFRS